MERLNENTVSILAQNAYVEYKQAVDAQKSVATSKPHGLLEQIAARKARKHAANEVHVALHRAQKLFGPDGRYNVAVVDWAHKWAQEKTRAQAEVARKQSEFDSITAFFDTIVALPETTYTSRTETVRCEEPYLPRHVRTYFVTVTAEQAQINTTSLERTTIIDGDESTSVTGELIADGEAITFEASPSTGFNGQRASLYAPQKSTTLNLATFNQLYRPHLLPTPVE